MFGVLRILLVALWLVVMADELPDLPPLISLLSDDELDPVLEVNCDFLDKTLVPEDFFDSDRLVAFCMILCAALTCQRSLEFVRPLVFDKRTHECQFSCSGPFTSTQEDGPGMSEIPVIFSSLQHGARDTCAFDDEDKQQLMSTVNPDVPNFTLLPDSNNEPDIPCTQPRYHVKDMWWPERELLVPYPSSDDSDAEKSASRDCAGGQLQAAQAINIPPLPVQNPEPTSRFKSPSSEQVLRELSVKKFAPSTERKIQWAVSLYEE